MTDIVHLMTDKNKQDLYTTSDIIAEHTGVKHHAIKQIIKRHESDLKEFGRVRFEITPLETQKTGISTSYKAEIQAGISAHQMPKIKGRGRPETNYRLNEQQATLVITYLQNTAPVRAFKKELVRQFFLMRSELIKRQQARADLKPVRRELTDAIRDRPDLSSNKWAYKQFTDLAYKQAIGKTSAVIKRERGAMPDSTAVSFLSSEELEALQTVSNQIAVLIDLGMNYQEIKTAIKKDRESLRKKSLTAYKQTP